MDANRLYPIEGFTNTILLKPLVAQSDVTNVEVGEFSYYSDFEDPTRFLEQNVLYNFGFSGTKLRIGKFCAIAHGVRIIMADANHATQGVSTFPFAVFGGKWAEAMPIEQYPFKSYPDIVIGNDVVSCQRIQHDSILHIDLVEGVHRILSRAPSCTKYIT